MRRSTVQSEGKLEMYVGRLASADTARSAALSLLEVITLNFVARRRRLLLVDDGGWRLNSP